MGQVIVKGIDQIKPHIFGKKFLLVRDEAYDCLEIKKFFEGFPHVEFTGVTPNPLYEQVWEGVGLFNKEQCDLIVAVGGGSAIDVAKCIKLYCKMDRDMNYLCQETFDSGITLIAIPTTAGTGSESTHHAVIYYEGSKQSVSHGSIVPNYVVLDASVLRTLPVYQKKCTMMDALSQAIESWWSVNSTEESAKYSKEAIRAIKENWEGYIFHNSAESAERIMEAANMAGCAIDITATTAAHAMSYKITSIYKFPHGHAVAVCLPEVWDHMLRHVEDCVDRRGALYLRDTLDRISSSLDVGYYKMMREKMGLAFPVSGDKDRELDELVCSVNPERLRNNPVRLSAHTLREMYRRIIQ